VIWNLCIRRPVLTSVVWVVVAIFGIYGFNQMPVREQPDVDPPIVSVNVVLLGAEPEGLETEVIEPLEEEINTIEGLKELTSTAREQVATIERQQWQNVELNRRLRTVYSWMGLMREGETSYPATLEALRTASAGGPGPSEEHVAEAPAGGEDDRTAGDTGPRGDDE